MKPRILFVDDEPDVLAGLRLRLRPRRAQWDMCFAQSGREALGLLAKEPCCIVVSDLRMPEMDGAALMQEVRRLHPHTARVMLSGHGEERLVVRAMAASHDFLPKPSPPGALESTLERICALQAVLDDPTVREAVGRIASLPPQLAVYERVLEVVTSEGSSPEAVAEVLQKDVSLCAHLLHIVNSAYFRRSRPIIKLEEAVVYLGMNAVRQLVLVAEVYRETTSRASVLGSRVASLQEHCLATARLASSLVSGNANKEQAFVAALLHDLGKIVIDAYLPERAEAIFQRMHDSGEAMCTCERMLYGVTHAEVGGYLLGLWQLPFPVVEAVANHHHPGAVTVTELGVVLAVHVADYLMHEREARAAGVPAERYAELDVRLLGQLGLEGQLDSWRALAERLAPVAPRMAEELPLAPGAN